jgi:disulfide bond formation protein DsbB
MLGAAHASERFGDLAPCNLCLKQREVLLGRGRRRPDATLWHLISRGSRGTPRIAAFLLAVIFATGTITAVFHMGGEMKWWDLPATCGRRRGQPRKPGLPGPRHRTDRSARLVRRGDMAFLGLSMAAWNALISAGPGRVQPSRRQEAQGCQRPRS